jgi:hypothetical protein
MRIRSQLAKIMQIHADPDPQPWLNGFCSMGKVINEKVKVK